MTNRKNILNRWDRIMVAIAFAEAGEPVVTGDIIGQNKENRKKDANITKRREERRPRATLRI